MRRARFAQTAAVVAVSALALAACSSGGSSSAASSGSGAGSVITANGSEPQNPLIPSNTNEVGGGRIVDNVFAKLVAYDASGKPTNDVAQSITTSDSQHFTIKIKPGQKFTNGEPVTAQSFVDAWNYGAYGPNAQLSSYFYAPIEGFDAVSPSEDAQGNTPEPTAKTLSGLKVVDDTTFDVTLSSPQADFPLSLGYSAFAPLPQAFFKDPKAFGEDPIGNGPYKLKSKDAWQHNVQIDLVPNPDYNGPHKAKNGGLTFKFYNSLDAAYSDLQANNLDVLDTVPPSAFKTYKQDLGDRAINVPSGVAQDFQVPYYLPGFGNDKEGQLRRQAISLAIDRAQITKTIFSGTRTPATDFSAPNIPGYSAKIPGNEVLKYDPAKAKQLWAEANAIKPYSGTFTIAYNADGGHQEWVDAVTNQIKNNLGIQAEGKSYPDFKSLRADVTAKKLTGGARSGWQPDYPSLQDYLGPIYVTGAGSNDSVYSNPDFDKLISEGSAKTNVADAEKVWQQSEEILFRDLPAIPLWNANATGGYAEGVSNVKFGWDSVPLYYQITK